MKIIYVCTPYAGADREKNVQFAEATCRAIARAGAVPFAPHLLYTRFLDDGIGAERSLGIECGLTMMRRADEVWFRLPPWRKEFSIGMEGEREAAMALGKMAVMIETESAWGIALARISDEIEATR